MRTKWIPLTLTTLALTVASSAAAQGATKPLKIGLVQINLQAKFFNDINAGAQAAAKKANIDLQIINANNDPTAQVSLPRGEWYVGGHRRELLEELGVREIQLARIRLADGGEVRPPGRARRGGFNPGERHFIVLRLRVA